MKTEHQRGQFTFYASYFDAVDRLPKSRRAEAFYALVLYALDGIEPEGLSAGVEGVFEAVRPNIDSGRAKAEKMQNTKCKVQNKDETEAKTKVKNKNKIKTKSKTETKTEIKTKSEAKAETKAAPAEGNAAAPSAAGAEGLSPAAGLCGTEAGSGLLSLPDREKQDFLSREGERTEDRNAGHSVDRTEDLTVERNADHSIDRTEDRAGSCPEPLPEEREPYAEMFRADPLLGSAWRDLLVQGERGRPLSPARRERILAELRAAPPWERLALLGDRLGSCYARDWETVRRLARIPPKNSG